jgi:AraC family transcriptional regulator of adaptative response/methylated-DNA-[protein]-cysteine methyltransferase
MDRAVRSRDASYDGVFFTAVRSTAIFCRPSCPARKPRPENVEFFATAREAIASGYRACLRCKPLRIGGAPEWVERLVARVEGDPTARLADRDLRAMGIDPARARRYFRRKHGMTFHDYRRGRRLTTALSAIRKGRPIDDALSGAGYASHSGFRTAFARAFSSTPGRGVEIDAVSLAWMETPLGPMIAGATTEGICLLEFTDRRALGTELADFKLPLVPGDSPLLQRLGDELRAYFAGKLRKFTVPLVYPGSKFETAVWKALLDIPYGDTRSYEDIARAVGNPKAVRAVGSANGRNRIAIVIPCHRVVNKSGELGGYGGGLWRKKLLLHTEKTGEPLTATSSP